VAVGSLNKHDAIHLLNDNGPLAVSSANLTGHPAATAIEEAQAMLGDAVDVYLDGGPTPGNVASTIVDCTGPVLRVVRLGVIGVDRLREVAPDIEAPSEAGTADDGPDESGEG